MTSGHENGIENANELLLYTYMIYVYRKGHLLKACFEARDNLCHKIREWKRFPIIFEARE